MVVFGFLSFQHAFVENCFFVFLFVFQVVVSLVKIFLLFVCRVKQFCCTFVQEKQNNGPDRFQGIKIAEYENLLVMANQ